MSADRAEHIPAPAQTGDAPANPWRWQRVPALIAGAVGLATLVALGLARPTDAFRGYLFGYLFWLAIPVGSLAFMMLYHLVGGDWGLAIRRPLQSSAMNLPLMALLFLPLLAGLPAIYPWARAEFLEAPHAAHKVWFFFWPNHGPPRFPVFFLLRAALCFGVWTFLAVALILWTRAQETNPTPERAHRLAALSAPGFVLYALIGTVAAVDWIMSINAEWYSTIFGLYVLVGQALSAMSFCVLLATREALAMPAPEHDYEPAHDALPPPGRWSIPPSILHDLGNLLFMAMNLYAYVAFSQMIIIWSGNIPEEVTWYTERTRGAWRYVPVLLVVLHFALPFAVLLSRKVKRRPDVLRLVAVLLLAMRVVDWAWMLLPSFHDAGAWTLALSLAALVGVGGVWLAAFTLWPAPPPPQPQPVNYPVTASGSEALT